MLAFLELEWVRFIPGCDLERMTELRKSPKPIAPSARCVRNITLATRWVGPTACR